MVVAGDFAVAVVSFSAMARFAVVLMRTVKEGGEFGLGQGSSAVHVVLPLVTIIGTQAGQDTLEI